jgi:Zn-dependent peptidase ImmA (M78 family)
LCNQAAAELLVPAEILAEKWEARPDTLEFAQELAKQFRVSTFVILIRAYELKLLPLESFHSVYAQARQEVKERDSKTERGGGDFYRTLRNRNGRTLTQEIITALRQGSILYQEAAGLLNIRPHTLETAIQRLAG